ncbi:MAG: hypothetical protein IKD53_11015 [Clostridia bacterium]|nr:hypothetical protein [Clostridia bacterium]
MSEVLETLVYKYEAIRAQYEEADAALKELRQQRDAAEQEVVRSILTMAEETGADDLTVKVGPYKYSAAMKDYFGITKAEQDEAFPLLRELGHGDLITERVDDRTLSKELMGVMADNDGELPPEYEPLMLHLNRYTKTTLTRRKA